VSKIAKLFKNGGSQAVRLPADCRFEGDQVYVTRDPVTGDVLLSSRPGAPSWRRLFDMLHQIEGNAEFMQERPMNRTPSHKGLFDDVADRT